MIITNLDDLFDKSGIKYETKYENEELDQSINYFNYLDDNGLSITENNLEIDLKSILYSKYYWFSKFMRCHKLQFGNDLGIEQKKFKLLEELDRQLCEEVDYRIIREIDESIFIKDVDYKGVKETARQDHSSFSTKE